MNFKGLDLSPLVSGLIAIVGAGLIWLGRKVSAAQSASAEQSKAAAAGLKVGALAVAMLGRAWDKLSPQVQAALADGKISAEERAAIEATVRGLVTDFTSEDDLAALANALGLPFAGIIAKIASILIDRFTAAHDPAVPTSSALQFPVAQFEVVKTDPEPVVG